VIVEGIDAELDAVVDAKALKAALTRRWVSARQPRRCRDADFALSLMRMASKWYASGESAASPPANTPARLGP
jgi:hypothetical protein